MVNGLLQVYSKLDKKPMKIIQANFCMKIIGSNGLNKWDNNHEDI